MKHECIGRAATSKAGRDRGRTFLIVGICDDNHVYLADGETRKLAAPKKKKLKHLRIEAETAESIREKLIEGSRIFDAEIRRNLLSLGYNTEPEHQEG